MAERNITLELTGLDEWDLESLKQTINDANLPLDAIELTLHTREKGNGPRAFEPGMIALGIAIAHYSVPAVSAVIIAWLQSRSAAKPIVAKLDGKHETRADLTTVLKRMSRHERPRT